MIYDPSPLDCFSCRTISIRLSLKASVVIRYGIIKQKGRNYDLSKMSVGN